MMQLWSIALSGVACGIFAAFLAYQFINWLLTRKEWEYEMKPLPKLTPEEKQIEKQQEEERQASHPIPAVDFTFTYKGQKIIFSLLSGEYDLPGMDDEKLKVALAFAKRLVQDARLSLPYEIISEFKDLKISLRDTHYFIIDCEAELKKRGLI